MVAEAAEQAGDRAVATPELERILADDNIHNVKAGLARLYRNGWIALDDLTDRDVDPEIIAFVSRAVRIRRTGRYVNR